MSIQAEELKSKLALLPQDERAALAEFLLLSLEGVSDTDVEAAWDAELERRAQDIQNGSATGEPWEKVIEELRARFS